MKIDVPIEDIVYISMEKSSKASKNSGETKAPSPDWLPNLTLNTAIELRSDLFLEVYITYLCTEISL